MKKILTMFLSVSLLMAALSGCGAGNAKNPAKNSDVNEPNNTPTVSEIATQPLDENMSLEELEVEAYRRDLQTIRQMTFDLDDISSIDLRPIAKAYNEGMCVFTNNKNLYSDAMFARDAWSLRESPSYGFTKGIYNCGLENMSNEALASQVLFTEDNGVVATVDVSRLVNTNYFPEAAFVNDALIQALVGEDNYKTAQNAGDSFEGNLSIGGVDWEVSIDFDKSTLSMKRVGAAAWTGKDTAATATAVMDKGSEISSMLGNVNFGDTMLAHEKLLTKSGAEKAATDAGLGMTELKNTGYYVAKTYVGDAVNCSVLSTWQNADVKQTTTLTVTVQGALSFTLLKNEEVTDISSTYLVKEAFENNYGYKTATDLKMIDAASQRTQSISAGLGTPLTEDDVATLDRWKTDSSMISERTSLYGGTSTKTYYGDLTGRIDTENYLKGATYAEEDGNLISYAADSNSYTSYYQLILEKNMFSSDTDFSKYTDNVSAYINS